MEKDNTYRKLEKDFAAIRDERGTQANTANRIGSAFLSLLSYIGSAAFLRKDVPDTAEQVMSFLKGIVAKAVSYFQGIENRGDITNTGNITNAGNISNAGDITNSGTITTKNINVTGKATFFELEIQKAKAAGGMTVNSAGSFHIDAVEETIDGYVCYQRAEQDGVMLLQTCEPKDQMMCSNGMNILKGGKGNHYYWRKVTKAPKKVVMHTIDGKEEQCLKIVLSKTDHSDNTVDIPQVGDDLVQMGNPDNKERQSVIMTCAYNSFDRDLKAPYWVQYGGVNDYKLSTHKRTWFAANGSQVTGNFKVQSENGGLKSIEDYMNGLTTNTVVWHVAFSIRNITGKKGETFRLKYGRTEGEDTSWYDDNPTHQGFNLLYAVIIDDATGNQQQAVLGEDLKVAKFFTGGSLTVHLKNSNTGEILAQDTIYPEAKQGKDAVSYKLIPMQEAAVAYKAQNGDKLVKLLLKYKVQKTVGEVTQELALGDEGITLSVVGITETFVLTDGAYVLDKENIPYKEENIETYVVTLTKGSNIVDQRIVPITFKPKVVFDIDTDNGSLTSRIETAEGKVSSFEQDIKKTQITVGKLDEQYSQLKVKSDEISLTVNNGTRPNLLWGSDLDLSEMQDKIQFAYEQGTDIKQKTAEKENLQRQLDATPTNDTAKRNDLQKQINDCDNAINTARNQVNECKAAIQKHLGVGLNATRVDSTEWFEYLKGGGVGGADAIKAKVAAVNGEGNYYAGLYWQTGFGAKQHIKVKPNTEYTYSFWLKTEILQGSGYVVVESFNMKSLTGGRKGRTMPWTSVPVKNKWERMSYTFTTGDTGYIMVGVGLSGEDDFSGLIYLCRPKLEEGNTATPWCAYDGTEDALLATGLDIKNRKVTFTSDNFIIRNNNGDVTVTIDRNGMMQFYGKDKIYPGIRFGVNEAGEMVLEFWRGNKMMYDLGPDNVFQKLDRVESCFEEADLSPVVVYTSYGENFIRRDYGENVYILREGYKMIGNVRQYDVSVGQHPSAYDGKIFTKTVSPINSLTMLRLPKVTGKYVHVFDAMAIDNIEKASKAGQITEQRNIQVISVQDGVALPGNAVIEGDGGRVKIHFGSYKIPDELKPLNFEH